MQVKGGVALSFGRIKEISKSYQNRIKSFEAKHEELLRIFKNTPLSNDMAAYEEAVEEAYGLNVQAGWISDYGEFDQSDCREAVRAVRVHVRVEAEEHGTVHPVRRSVLGLEHVLPYMLEGRGLCLPATGGPRHTWMLIEYPAN